MPPRKPTNLKILEGTYRKDRAKNEPKPKPIAPKKPAWLKDKAARAWKDFGRELEPLGLLTTIDGPAFAMLCLHYSLAAEAYKEIQTNGIYDIDEHGCQRKSPLLQVLRDQSAAFKTYAVQFGLTPASRGGLDLPEKDKETDDFMEFLLRNPGHEAKRGKGTGK